MVPSLMRKLHLTMLQIKLINFVLKYLILSFWVQTFIGLDLRGAGASFSSVVLQIMVQIQALGVPPMPVNLICQETSSNPGIQSLKLKTKQCLSWLWLVSKQGSGPLPKGVLFAAALLWGLMQFNSLDTNTPIPVWPLYYSVLHQV